MLTPEEEGFIRYWEQNRLRKRKIWRQLSVGLPLGAALGGAMLVNIYSGWNPAGTFLRHNKSLFLVVLLAVLAIVIFVIIFSARHRWDMQEQQYQELLRRRDK